MTYEFSTSAAPRKVLQRKTAVELVVEEIRQRILRGDYPEGTALRQESLAADLGVSRIPIRESLRHLEAEGLVDFNPHTGAVVSTLSLSEITELFELRALLEAELLREAVPKLTPEILERADALIEEFARISEVGSLADQCELNWSFHATLLGAADRPLTLNVLSTLHRQSDRYMRMQLKLMKGAERAQKEHRAIVALARQGDAQCASEAMREHVRSAGRSLIEFLQDRRAERVPA